MHPISFKRVFILFNLFFMCFANTCAQKEIIQITPASSTSSVNYVPHSSQEFQYETKVDVKNIPHKVIYKFNRQLRRGILKKANEGKAGALITKWLITKKAGKIINKKIINIEKSEPVDTEIHMGPGGFQASRHSSGRERSPHFRAAKVMTMNATAYTAHPRENGGYRTTKTGMPLRDGVIAVDPKVIPLRSVVYVEGPWGGFYTAQDTGRAIKGKKIDVCIPNRQEALRFGRRKVKVHILHID